MAAEVGKALVLAERHGVDLGIEPEQANIVTSAADALRLIGELGSRRLRVVLDPANLFERATAAEARAIVAAAVEATAGHDRHGARQGPRRRGPVRCRRAGRRGLSRLRRAACKAAGFDGPLVAHGLSADEAPAVARDLRSLV